MALRSCSLFFDKLPLSFIAHLVPNPVLTRKPANQAGAKSFPKNAFLVHTRYNNASELTTYTGPEGTLTYTMDSVSELTGVGGARSETYGYDLNGNASWMKLPYYRPDGHLKGCLQDPFQVFHRHRAWIHPEDAFDSERLFRKGPQLVPGHAQVPQP